MRVSSHTRSRPGPLHNTLYLKSACPLGGLPPHPMRAEADTHTLSLPLTGKVELQSGFQTT